MPVRLNIQVNAKSIDAVAGIASSILNHFSNKARQNSDIAQSNPYEILGISIDASSEQIKQRYLDLAKIYHPDKRNGDTKAMARLNEAYEQVCQVKGLTKF